MPGYQRLSERPPSPPFRFSICTIVTKMDEYDLMKKSFEEAGFQDQCEYIIADNTSGNNFDAYRAIRGFLRDARGEFVIIVHQDVRCIDTHTHFEACLDQLDKMDPSWAVCGNSGANGYHRYLLHINNNGRIMKHGGLPARVNSLDENMLVIKRNSGVNVSADLKGFHLYGTDICLVAGFMGYTCYVIPFLVKHLSLGNLRDLATYRASFVEQYGKKFPGGYIQTTCTKFYLGDSPGGNRFYNSPVVFFFIKTYERLKFGLHQLMGRKHPRRTVIPEESKSA